jgi:4-coumarate--CoA ligase
VKTTIAALQEDGNSLPPGEKNTGEICVRGPNVMKGYLNNPAATAKTIINGWMHTGDVAWRDEDGNIRIVDRLKELIKSKGFQVAPAELEGLLLQHPGVMDCAVIGKYDERSGEVPVAFVVKRSAPVGNAPGSQDWIEPTGDELKAWIEGRVAEYKRLAHVVFTDVIPKNPSGKILRRVLRTQLEQLAKEGNLK